MMEFNTIIFIFLLLVIYLTNNAIHALLSLILIFINVAIVLFYFDILFLYIIRIFNVLNKTNFFGILAIISVSFTTDLTLLLSYLFESHPVYLLFSMLLLLVALVIRIFLSIDYKPSFILSYDILNFTNHSFFSGHLQKQLSIGLDKNKLFIYYFSLFKRINWIITLCSYGFFFNIYNFIMPSYLHNYLKQNPHIISCLQGVALGINWPLTCSFHLFLHNFLFRIELINDHLIRNHEDFLIVTHILSEMRRSIFPITRFLERVGTSGLGNMGNPKGNGRQVLAWCAVTGAGLAMYNYRKYKVAELHERTAVYKTDTKAQSDRYKTERAWDEYRKDKDVWDHAGWGRGKPPTPPIY